MISLSRWERGRVRVAGSARIRMNQILLGALLPFLVSAVLFARSKCRASMAMLVLTPVLMVLGSVWAIVPDLPRVFGHYNLYHRLSMDPRMNIFFWHYTIDQVESDLLPYHAGIVVMFILLLAAAWRELYLRESKG